jgi:LacI family transcriptional regulator
MPKHRMIFEALQSQISAGKFADGKRLPSEAELARRFKVSRPTAARALRDLQGLGLLDRRVGSGTYIRTTGTTPPSGTVLGLFVPGLGHTEILDPICNEISRAAQAQAQQVSVLWGDSPGVAATAQAAEEMCQRYIERKVHGVFFAPLEQVADRESINRRVAETLRRAGIAVVLLDRDVLEFPHRSDFDLIGINNFQAAFELADYLAASGRKTFRFVARTEYPATTDLRLAGCREAILRRGLHVDHTWARFGDPTDRAFVKSVLTPRPDVIMCANDLTAALLIQTLTAMDVRLPEDISIVGFDDVKYATLLSVPLTTIRQPCREMGQVAVETMLHRIKNPASPPREILLKGELVVRRSCGTGGSNAKANP